VNPTLHEIHRLLSVVSYGVGERKDCQVIFVPANDCNDLKLSYAHSFSYCQNKVNFMRGFVLFLLAWVYIVSSCQESKSNNCWNEKYQQSCKTFTVKNETCMFYCEKYGNCNCVQLEDSNVYCDQDHFYKCLSCSAEGKTYV
jgi:hypothetical protein